MTLRRNYSSEAVMQLGADLISLLQGVRAEINEYPDEEPGLLERFNQSTSNAKSHRKYVK